MMKAPGGWAVAVRDQQGAIHLRQERLKKLPSFLTLPLIRGIVALYQALSIGIRALEFSAQRAYTDTEEKPMSPAAIGSSIAIAVVLAILLFIFLPLYITKVVGMVAASVSASSLLFNLVDGVVRVLIFLVYVFAIGLWKEMRRIFEYHGAEHKVIHAYEAGKSLDLASVRDYSPQHPRCGTSFLLIVMVISILVFSFIPQQWHFGWKFLSRIILIPFIAGISYELLRLSARLSHNHPLVHLLILPGLLLQRLTTREPDDSQLEVAIVAVKEALLLEEGNAPEA
jgi:uncharacterized protein YqhQ